MPLQVAIQFTILNTMMHSSSSNVSWEYLSCCEDDTKRFGQWLAEFLKPGLVLALIGNLGSGKTRLVQAVAETLGVDRKLVNSPTFVLMQEYAGELPIYHFDVYRLNDEHEFLDLGADELMDSDGVCLIEWADRVRNVLPADVVTINFEITGPTARRFHISASGSNSQALVESLIAKRDRGDGVD